MKHSIFKRVGAIATAALMTASLMVGASAANVTEATIDTSRKASLTLFKYDLTGAEEAGAWSTESYVSTGLYDEAVNTALNPYAVEGVEFSYIRVADIDILKENENGIQHVMPLYGFHEDVKTSSKATVDLLSALGLSTNVAYKVTHDSSQNRVWYFTSDKLIDALSNALTTNATNTKDALEVYMKQNGGTAMPETDASGKSAVDNLEQGLYLVVETRVPENVVDTTAPFLVSLPMTTVDGSEWNYDLTLYPKNETGNPTLEKTVREAKADTGKHNGTTNDITDGYTHTTTVSDGDTVEYQIVSTLPTITSSATSLTTYTFVDELTKGIRYQGEQFDTDDVKLEFFRDTACTDLITTWTEGDGRFDVAYTDYSTESGTTMTISMTADGLKEINTATSVYDSTTSLLRGYSNCTLRITYACTVNSDATTVYGDSGNPNEVTLTWKRTNTDYFDTLRDDCHVYVYGLDLTKQFSDNNGNFENVSFIMENSADGYFVKAELDKNEGIYYVTGHTEQETEATALIPTKGGRVLVKGLEDDSYTITETATDKGYTLLKEAISVQISAAEGAEICPVCGRALLVASATVNGQAVEMENDNASVHALVPLTVTNTRGFDLPKTGGTGSRAIYVAGGVAMLATLGIVLAVVRKKRHG